MKKIALICGVSGQDGGYLAEFLVKKGYEVWGTSRDALGPSFYNLTKLNIKSSVKLISMAPEDFRSVFMAFKKSKAEEVYFLAGQSSVGMSFEQPAETLGSIAIGTLNMLEAARMVDWPVKIYHAGSSECFGNINGIAADEATPFKPCSPYAVAKASAYWLVKNYCESYSLFVCTGLLFNHESPFRSARFVTQKIIQAAYNIAQGSSEVLQLGNLDIARDWGWAPEYVEAMWLMLQQDKPEDFVIATGHTYTLEQFVAEAFSIYGLNWQNHIEQSVALYRPSDIMVSKANPAKAEEKLGWKATYKMPDIVRFMSKSL
jgi:GDPmannose 4,6-dehydratase